MTSDALKAGRNLVADSIVWSRSSATVPLLLLVGGCVNGFTARVGETLSDNGFSSLFLGISPVYLLTIVVAVHLLRSATAVAPSSYGWPEVLTLLGLLVPPSTVAWLTTGSYAAYLARKSRDGARAGALLIVALALTAIWSDAGIKWLAIPVTSLEAKLVASLIGLFRDDIVQVGNVVGQANGHSLIILTACASLDGLPRLLLGIASVALFLGPVEARRLGVAMAIAATLYIATNLIRLTFMTWSADWYAIVHSPTGANIFDLFGTALVLMFGSSVAARHRS